MKLKKHHIPLEPSFYIVVLAAGVKDLPDINTAGIATTQFFQDTYIGYTKDEAVKGTLKKLQTENPNLYSHGNSIGGWEITYIQEISATKLEERFKARADLEKKTEKDKLNLEKNELLKKIIDTKDIDLLHRVIIDGRISDYERKYVHEKLTEGLPDKAEEALRSPYDYE